MNRSPLSTFTVSQFYPLWAWGQPAGFASLLSWSSSYSSNSSSPSAGPSSYVLLWMSPHAILPPVYRIALWSYRDRVYSLLGWYLSVGWSVRLVRFWPLRAWPDRFFLWFWCLLGTVFARCPTIAVSFVVDQSIIISEVPISHRASDVRVAYFLGLPALSPSSL